MYTHTLHYILFSYKFLCNWLFFVPIQLKSNVIIFYNINLYFYLLILKFKDNLLQDNLIKLLSNVQIE